MATLGSINLGANTRWLKEFADSAIENRQKWTEEGRLFVFQSPKQKFRKIEFDCGWQSYQTVQSLESVRDSGEVVVLTHNDSRTFNVILEKIEAEPVRKTNAHVESSKFAVLLTLIEV
jgi:hypothetical protein